MKNIILLLLFFLTTNIYAQETHVSEIYSPEYKKKLEKEKTAEVKKESPNKMVLRLGLGTFANYTYGHDNLQDKTFNMFNWMYSGMIGYRTGFNTKSYKSPDSFSMILGLNGGVQASLSINLTNLLTGPISISLEIKPASWS